ncbi:MAG: hypothetical protein RMM98_09785 [Acidobacteriota bacterium]|nr:hypothetical protein [Blastocatellia bacterium]MDW8239893.1 hypothetical protein [Acidobacteriota bacterium]
MSEPVVADVGWSEIDHPGQKLTTEKFHFMNWLQPGGQILTT